MTSASPSNVDRQPFVGPLPEGEAYSPLLAPPASVAMRSGLVTLDPGAECGEHSTESHEEMIVCLAGEGEIDAAGQTTPLAAGQMAYNPPNTLHNVRNTGAAAMRYLFIVAPAPQGQ